MIPSSDTMEVFFDRLQELDDKLAKLNDSEVTNSELIHDLSEIAKTWLRFSQTLRTCGFIESTKIDSVDERMQDVLKSNTKRTRANTYRKKITPIVQGFLDQFIVPLIKYEGNPSQVAGRHLYNTFEGYCTPEELQYVDEAVRCLTSKCYRACIILLWASAIARFHSAIEIIGFKSFNTALDNSLAKKGRPYSGVSKTAHITSLPELQRSREWDLIVVGMELWGYDLQTFEELERLLGIRNNCAHPGMSNPGTIDVQHFASKLVACVFSKIKLSA